MITIQDKLAAAEIEDRRLRNQRFEIEKQLAAVNARIRALHVDLSRELKAAGEIKFAITDLARIAPNWIHDGGGKLQTRIGVLFRTGSIVEVMELPLGGSYLVAAWGMVVNIPGEYLEAVSKSTTMRITPNNETYRNESDDQGEGSR